ncbi:hypothetical protein DFH28DRAFT_967788 [Melampsora americana]|nr:hypothetical protein DFH28DRAFT_967788 [Melampsora americana]
MEASQVDQPVEPRFLATDLQRLPTFFCKSSATVHTTCSSLVMPSNEVVGFPLDHVEVRLQKDEWRIRKEYLGDGRSKVECWVQGVGWPAKTFCVCGWLIGIDRREFWLTYQIDDGTAVLECRIAIRQLQDIDSFRNAPFQRTPSHDESDIPTTEGPEPITKTSDPKLDPYRRPPIPSKKTINHRDKLYSADPSISILTDVEVLVEKYLNIPIGTTLRVSGHPREVYNGRTRVLEVDRVSSVHDPNEEIRFRKHVINSRCHVYNRLFRLKDICPEALAQPQDSLKRNIGLVSQTNGSTGEDTSKSTKPSTSQSKRLRLRKVEAIEPEEATFSLFLTYLAHHITKTCTTPKPRNKPGHPPLPKPKETPIFTISDLIGNSELRSLVIKVIHKKEYEQQATSGPSANSSTPNFRLVGSKAKPSLLMNAQTKELHKDATVTKHFDSRASGPSRPDLESFTSELTSQELEQRIKSQFEKAMHRLIVRGIVILSPEFEDKFTIPDLHSLGRFLKKILNQSSGSTRKVNENDRYFKLETIMSILKRDEMWKWIHEDKVSEVLEGMIEVGEVLKIFDGLDWKWTLKEVVLVE